MVLRPPAISTDMFHYHKKHKSFTAELSDLRDFRVGRVYDDACDEGFTMVSQWTGQEVVFALERRKTDREGDVQFWEYISVTPKFRGFTVTIFND